MKFPSDTELIKKEIMFDGHEFEIKAFWQVLDDNFTVINAFLKTKEFCVNRVRWQSLKKC